MLESIDISPSPQEEMNVSECDLVIRAQRGDLVAFETLYRLYSERINRYITRITGNYQVSCEITQDTFLKAWQGLPTLRDPVSFMAWLYRIATNKAFNYIHRERKFSMVPWEQSVLPPVASNLSELESRIEDRELIRLVLVGLRPTYRICLILYVVEQLPRQRVAEILGISISSVDKYISRSKEAFRKMYYQLNAQMHAELAKHT